MMDFLQTIQDSYYASVVFRLVVAALLGALIGMEREYRGRDAGFRTHLLVAMGSALVMIVSLHFAETYADSTSPVIRIDPARVAYGVMTGVGFLGAGAMIRYGINVRGMTTAACLWCTAAVGLAVGFGMFPAAIATTIIVLIALLLLSKLEKRFPSRQYKSLRIVARRDAGITMDQISLLLKQSRVKIVDIDYRCDFQVGRETFTLHVAILSRVKTDDVLAIADKLPPLISLTIQ
jgi:putative Mg2+ transporter-C (MgtC) family protein